MLTKKDLYKLKSLHLQVFLSVMVFMMTKLSAQISSPAADRAVLTSYSSVVQDSIFVFNSPETTGEIEVTPSGSGSFALSLHKFNFSSGLFDIAVKDTTINSQSTLKNLTEGGYQIVLNDGSTTDSSVFWIYINESFSYVGKTTIPFTSNWENGCPRQVDLKTPVSMDTLYYYDYRAKKPLEYNQGYEGEWIGEPVSVELRTVQKAATFWQIIDSSNYPLEDTRLHLKLTDLFGPEEYGDSVDIPALGTKASFEAELDSLKFDDGEYYYNYDQSSGDNLNSAPLKMILDADSSKNVSYYAWDFGDGRKDSVFVSGDTTEVIETKVFHVFPYPDSTGRQYKVVLITESPYGCRSRDTAMISVTPPNKFQIEELPNFFKPGSEDFKYFRPFDISIEEFEITIFTRQGGVVHKFRGENIREWQGWDGTVRNTNRFVPDGVYFYVIKYKPFNGEVKKVTGFVHTYSE